MLRILPVAGAPLISRAEQECVPSFVASQALRSGFAILPRMSVSERRPSLTDSTWPDIVPETPPSATVAGQGLARPACLHHQKLRRARLDHQEGPSQLLLHPIGPSRSAPGKC